MQGLQHAITHVSIVKNCASYKKVNLPALIEKVKKLTEENNQILKARQCQIMSFITLKENIHLLSADIIKHFDFKEQVHVILQDLEIHAAEYTQVMCFRVLLDIAEYGILRENKPPRPLPGVFPGLPLT